MTFYWFLGRHGYIVVNTVTSQQEGPEGLIPGWGRTFLCGVCMFCLCGFSLGSPVSPTGEPKYTYVRCISCQHPWLRYWLRIWSWSPHAALWLSTASQGWVECRDQISPYALYVTNKVPYMSYRVNNPAICQADIDCKLNHLIA